MGNNSSVVLKNLRAQPTQVPNDGSANVRVEAMAFTTADEAGIEEVFLDFSRWGGHPRHPLDFQPDEGIARTSEGLYTTSFNVPLMCDPGRYDLPVSARDSGGGTGTTPLSLEVSYRRPDYPPDILSPENQAVLDRIGAGARVAGNHVEALHSGNLAMERRMELIRSARRQINLEVYTLSSEGLCGRMVDALLERAADGVEVNMILNMSSQLAVSPLSALRVGLDKFGRDIQTMARKLEDVLDGRHGLLETLREVQESFQGFDWGKRGVNVILAGEDVILGAQKKSGASGKRSQKWLDQMEQDRNRLGERDGKWLPDPAAGLKRNLEIPSVPLLTYAIHEKILVVDGDRAVVGGRNLEDKYFTYWVDLDLYLEGPVVREIQAGFLRSWEAFSRNLGQERAAAEISVEPEAAGTQEVRFVQSRPWADEYAALETLVTAFQMAGSHIFMSSQYLVLPESLLREAILDAARRGVEVRILTNSYTTGLEVGFSAGHLVTLRHCGALIDAGVRIFEMIGPEAEEVPKPYLHAKQFYVDGKWAAMGSFNLSMRSCFIESENLVVVQDPDFVREQEASFRERLQRHATEMTRDILDKKKEQFRTKIAMTRDLDLFF